MRLPCVPGAFLALLAAACSPPAGQGPLVFAPASFGDVAEDLARGFSASVGHAPSFSLAASDTLAHQIEAGAPADLIISADPELLERLSRRGILLEEPVRIIAENTMVIVAPRGSRLRLEGPEDLRAVERLALADPEGVPAGRYARAWLEERGLWEELRPRVLPARDVRAALAIVAFGEADAGLVYATDAAAARVELAFAVPRGEGPRIQYAAALLRQARHPEARAFLDFLESEEGRAILARHGFQPPPTRGLR